MDHLYSEHPDLLSDVLCYSIEQDKSFAITDGLSEVSEPTFDAGGKYLYFFGSTDAGSVKQWFDLSNTEMSLTQSLYLVVLRKDLASHLAKESDEEKGVKKEETQKEEKTEEAKSNGDKPFSIDFDGIQNRILTLPIPAGKHSRLQAGEAEKFYYLKAVPPGAESPGQGGRIAELHRYDLAKRKDDVILGALSGYEISADGKKFFYFLREAAFIQPLSDKIQPGQGKINTDAIEVRIDPRAEWEQIFNEAWRINRDYSYAANMRGVDWNAMRQKHSVFLPDIEVRSDLNRVIQWMCSELRVGHHRVAEGDTLYQPKNVPGGLIADYYIDHLRRLLIVYWNMRYGADLKTPSASIQGPKVMLIDETAGSGGDLLPWMFRKFKLGKLIGKRTWGGLVGMLGFPPLMDGGYVTAPNLAIWTPEEGWAVENVGVPQDIEVEQTPAEVIAGHDPQLEKAIELVMEELEKNRHPSRKGRHTLLRLSTKRSDPIWMTGICQG
jgi:hypothetical protein